MHRFKLIFHDYDNFTVYFNDFSDKKYRDPSDGTIAEEITEDDISCSIEDHMQMLIVTFVNMKVEVRYFIKQVNCEFLLNDDLTINGKCQGALVFTEEYYFEDADVVHEFIENFSCDKIRCTQISVFERYDNIIFMEVLYFNLNSRTLFDVYGNDISTDVPDDPLHIQIKYDHGIITPLLSPIPPPQKKTKAASHDDVED
jgi:hypothetical protein